MSFFDEKCMKNAYSHIKYITGAGRPRRQECVVKYEDRHSVNIHLTRHIADAVRNLGPLWAQSAFAFEANDATLIKTTAKHTVLHSITWKYKARCFLRTEEVNEVDEPSILFKSKQIINLSKIDANVFFIFRLENRTRKGNNHLSARYHS